MRPSTLGAAGSDRVALVFGQRGNQRRPLYGTPLRMGGRSKRQGGAASGTAAPPIEEQNMRGTLGRASFHLAMKTRMVRPGYVPEAQIGQHFAHGSYRDGTSLARRPASSLNLRPRRSTP